MPQHATEITTIDEKLLVKYRVSQAGSKSHLYVTGGIMRTITTPSGFKVITSISRRRYIVVEENTGLNSATIVFRSDNLRDALDAGAPIGRYTYDATTGQEVI